LSKVFVVDTNKQALNPVHPAQARILLSKGRAAVLKRYPFTIVLKRTVDVPRVEPLRIKIDPGSRTTGLALVDDASGAVVFAAEITHRGQAVHAALTARRSARRSRRYRHTRYRQPRFWNRRKRNGWLPPSSNSRVGNTLTWVRRLMRACPVAAISLELVKFDTQLMQNPEMNAIDYQQGTLVGCEIREYLLEKWRRRCAYCGREGVPLEIEHIQPRARGGTDRVSNLALACEACNRAKGTQDIREFLASKPDVLMRILAQAKAPLRDVAAVNSTRWALYEQLKAEGLPIEAGSGGLTKWNRTRRGLPKAHWIDASCVGVSTPVQVSLDQVIPLRITAAGRQRRQMCLMDSYGFPRTKAKQRGARHAFRTGDIVRAVVPAQLKNAGTHVGRMAAKASGSFTIAMATGTVTDINHRYCTSVQRADGYGYIHKKGARDFIQNR
jgi:5-methylcytosine-specific restriction endonuclease McrA